ncbi:MAG TPA: UDP-3-O-(3-hydroxymyristoyl)glucosamine N-acyltransferase [Limnochordia bacterium]
MPNVYRLGELAQRVGGVLEGPARLEIEGAASLEQATEREISFVADASRRAAAQKSRAGALILPKGLDAGGKPAIRVEHPRLAFARALGLFAVPPDESPGIHPTAVIAPDAVVGEGVCIQAHVTIAPRARIGARCVLYPGVYVGEEAEIGEGTRVFANAVIRERVRIGRDCLIHPGAVIGSDGFGFVDDGARQVKVPQIGTVIIEDEVEIGANATVDRATVGATIVRRGTKIDNLVQIGHNVVVGADCIICALTGVAGSAVIGDRVTLAGQVGVKDHAEVGRCSRVAARSLVARRLPPGSMVSGDPARPHGEHLKVLAATQRLPDVLKQVQALERRIAALEAALQSASQGVGPTRGA